MPARKTIAFFPEGAFGPALNSVGIAQACQDLGHRGGHDNATRVEETGHGLKMHRSSWTDEQLAGGLERLVTDEAMQRRLDSTRTHMQARDGTRKAASLLDNLVQGTTPG